MQNQDKTISIYKDFIKSKLISYEQPLNKQIETCRKIFNEILSHADCYSKVLLENFKVHLTSLIASIECDLIDYTICYLDGDKD